MSDEGSAYKLHLGDCLEVMKTMESNSVDSICCDPPYGLAFMGAKWDSFGGATGKQTVDERKEEGIRYADENKGAPRYGNSHGKCATLEEMVNFQKSMTPIFAEALRVAKPGAYLLAFGGTRTYHRLACAIEDAGWEIRDCCMWVYGSGFPKSMDVSKAIDKMKGAEREVVGVSTHGSGPSLVKLQNHRKGDTGIGIMDGSGKVFNITAPATPEAAAWNGWGTALKPAVEPIVIARKPIEGTVAANVLKYGTGAINIDACRVPTESETISNHSRSPESAVSKGKYGDSKAQETHQTAGQQLGRFPANLIHDGSDEVLALFPDSKGQCGAVKGTEPSRTGSNGIYGNYNGQNTMSPRGDTGSAARFFYCAKASRSERGEGNVHPTVKPIALMRYLVRLVTRKGGMVLDPFMGSGTTGIAAIQEGLNFIGIEKEEKYFNIAKSRIEEESAKPVQEELF